MEAIMSVENEVDKVLRLFSNCKDTCNSKIGQLIDHVNKAKSEINELTSQDQTELDCKQASIIKSLCDIVQKSCAEITNSHRELHVPVSKIGKSIDKNFIVDFACASDTKLFHQPENSKLLNQSIVQHFLRYGMDTVAEVLIKEAGLNIDSRELVKFDEINEVLNCLRKRDVGPALKWAVANRKSLRQINSSLEFKIHRNNIIDLYKQGIEKQFEIIKYVRENLQHMDPTYNLDLQHLMGGIIYLKNGLENSPYKSFLDPINYKEIEDVFFSNACSLMDVSTRSPISVAFEAGCIALPSLLNINQMLTNQGVQNIWRLRDELPVEIDLGRNLQFHSVFSCPILKQQSTETNPPMRLICGHAISRDSMLKLGVDRNSKLKCPYCPMEQLASDAMLIRL